MDIQVKIARTREELEQAFRIRYNVFGEELGRLDLQKYSDQKEWDMYDSLGVTTNFIAFASGMPVGTARLIEDSRFGFPMDNLFSLYNLRIKSRKLGEGSRLAVIKEYRGGKGIGISLLKILHNCAIHKGITDICITSAANNIAEIYKKIGYHQIGNSIFYEKFNDNIIPMRLELSRLLEPFKTLFEEPSGFIEEPYNSSKMPIEVRFPV